MITAVHISGFAYSVNMDTADWKAINNLAKSYGITFDAMLVGCINKGIDVIGEQVAATARKKHDTQEAEKPDTGGG